MGSEPHVDVSTKIKPLKKDSDKSQPIVLVVEDNPDMRNYIEDILNHQYQTITAAGAVEGYTKAVKKYPI